VLPDVVRARVSYLLMAIAGQGAVVALCNRDREIEVSVGDVEAFLGVVDGTTGAFLSEHAGRQVWVERFATGFDLIVATDRESLSDVLGMCNSVHADLQSLLGPDGPDDPAMAKALRAPKPGAA
jgi:hypothetical protein